MFFAEFFYCEHSPVYEISEQKYYLYNEKNGLWEPVEKERIISLLWKLFHRYCNAYYEEDAKAKCNTKLMRDIMILVNDLAGHNGFFTNSKDITIHCKNGVLTYNKDRTDWKLQDFFPFFRSRNRSELEYDSSAKCPQFLEKLICPAMSKDDIEIFQMYLGQCLIGNNQSQTFMMMTGTAGAGKTTAVNIVEGIVGRFNCTELRLEHMGSRFELQRAVGKTLLTAKDVKSDFLNTSGACKLKAIVGNDTLTSEAKGINESADIQGHFSVIITANNNLRVKLDGDREAWRRRMLWIKYENQPPKEVIVDFDKVLLKEEGSGILNWALEGATKLLLNGGKIPRSKAQLQRVNNLLQESDSINTFVRECVVSAPDDSVTSTELLKAFTSYCRSRLWQLLPTRAIQRALPDAMLHIHDAVKRTDILRNGHTQRGYKGFMISMSQ
jgi:P4 family phage/plasmid primase-like protien